MQTHRYLSLGASLRRKGAWPLPTRLLLHRQSPAFAQPVAVAYQQAALWHCHIVQRGVNKAPCNIWPQAAPVGMAGKRARQPVLAVPCSLSRHRQVRLGALTPAPDPQYFVRLQRFSEELARERIALSTQHLNFPE